MISIYQLIKRISDDKAVLHVKHDTLSENCSAQLLNPMLSCKSSCVYVAELKTLTALADSDSRPETVTFFISGVPENNDLAEKLPGCSLIFSTLPLFELHYRLCRTLEELSETPAAGSEKERRQNAAMLELIRLLSSEAPAVEERFRELLSELKGRTYKYFKLSLIRFNNTSGINLREALSDAAGIFAKSNLTIFNEQIFVLSSSAHFHFSVTERTDALNDLLERYDAYIITSSSSQKSWGLQQMCRQLINAADVAWTINRHLAGSRIMDFSFFAIYHAIDMLSDRFESIYGHDDIMFLCHPYVVVLQRYDNAKGSDLCGFLRYFLLNGHSISKTAEQFHMHRNTAIYQRDKIIQLIHYEFDDPDKDFDLLFSLYLANYIKYYRGRTIKSLEYNKNEYVE